MTTTRKAVVVALLAGMGLGAATGTLAAGPIGADCHGRGTMLGGVGTPERGAMGADRGAARLAALKAELRLSAEQEAALWQPFAAAMQARQQSMAAVRAQRRAGGGERPGFLERLDRRAERMAGMGAVSEAARALYAGLAPEQQAVLDAMPLDRGRQAR